jgi:hypothetical protein
MALPQRRSDERARGESGPPTRTRAIEEAPATARKANYVAVVAMRGRSATELQRPTLRRCGRGPRASRGEAGARAKRSDRRSRRRRGEEEAEGTGRSLRDTARARDSSASGCREYSPSPESGARLQGQPTSRSEERAKARKVTEQKRVLEAVSRQ